MIQLTSFGFKHRTAPDAHLNIDVRALKNPYYDDSLRDLSGQAQAIIDFFEANEPMQQLLITLQQTILVLANEHDETPLNISIGCTGGQHRSVYLVEQLALRLQDKYPIEVFHLEQAKW